jgi:hypothetical protein
MSALLKTLHQHCTAAGRTWRSQGLEGRWRLGLRNWQTPQKLKAESLRISQKLLLSYLENTLK